MFLKRRNLIAWALLLIAAAAWILGQAEIRQAYYDHNVTATIAPTTSYTVYPTVPPTASETTPPTTQDSPQVPNQSQRFWGYVLCVFSGAAAIFGIFPLRQGFPLLGPDVILGIGAVYSWGYHTYVQGSGSLPYFFYDQPCQILLLFVLLFAVREFWDWVCTGFPLEWSCVHRLAKRAPVPQAAMVVYMAWITAAVAGIALVFDGRDWAAMGLLLAAAAFGFSGLWNYGMNIQHFQRQLDNFQEGTEITVKDGAFSATEQQLREVQAQHTQAVESAVKSERFKVELIANVSHDLRTPLTSILGYSELLQKEDLSPEGKAQLARLHKKAGYMNDLVESLFELTKVSSGVAESRKQELDLIRLLEQTIGLFDDRLTASGLTIRRSYAREAAPVTTDGARMHQVFANLIGNAIKYALSGTRIHLEVKEQPDAWTVRIVNTASYEMDFQEDDILQRFARGDKARSTQGSGLGLAIAQTYTESVGGSFRIRVDGDQFNAIVELPKL